MINNNITPDMYILDKEHLVYIAKTNPLQAGVSAVFKLSLALPLFPTLWGRQVSTGIREAKAAGRGAAGLVKSGNKVIANNDYEPAYAYAYAA